MERQSALDTGEASGGNCDSGQPPAPRLGRDNPVKMIKGNTKDLAREDKDSGHGQLGGHLAYLGQGCAAGNNDCLPHKEGIQQRAGHQDQATKNSSQASIVQGSVRRWRQTLEPTKKNLNGREARRLAKKAALSTSAGRLVNEVHARSGAAGPTPDLSTSALLGTATLTPAPSLTALAETAGRSLCKSTE